MTTFYNRFLPATAVFLVALLMQTLRVQTVQPGMVLSLMMLYMAGAIVGALYAFKNEYVSW